MKNYPTLLRLLTTISILVSTTNAFVSMPGSDMMIHRLPTMDSSSSSCRRDPVIVCRASSDGDDGDIMSNLQMRWRILQESRSAGYNLKVALTLAIAGEYDVPSTQAKLESLIDSAGCVMFTWANSPSCKSAVTALTDVIGADYKNVPLDDPWDEGNKLRAEIAKKVGRSSVPAIFIGGEYVGGYDGGTDEAPGIVNLSFQGKLLPMLEAVGAVKSGKAASVE